MTDLDRTDRKILDILQRQGRISMTDLAEQIGLSTSPCSERVRRMEREGVITGYHARIDPQAVGKTLLVFVEITLSSKSADVFDKVRQRPGEFLDSRTIESEGLDAAARDFLAGMTDRYAVRLFEQLFIPKPWIGPLAWTQI